MDNPSKTILVTGDFILDHHIYEGSRHHFGDTSQGVVVKPQIGGAEIVADILRVLPARAYSVVTTGDDKERLAKSSVAYAYWVPLPPEAEKEKKFWRCQTAMGFGEPDATSAAESKLLGVKPIEDWKCPDVVVISEGGAGYRDKEDSWHLESFKSAHTIVVKTAAGFLESGLWKYLSSNYKEKLTIVIDADELRNSGARISKGLSWESTFQTALKEVAAGGRLRQLSTCRNIIVTFGSEAAAWFDFKGSQLKNEDRVCFVYHAATIECDHQHGILGTAFGFMSCITATVARATLDFDSPVARHLFEAGIESGLAAMRDLREKGHGPALDRPNGFPSGRLAGTISSPDVCYTRADHTISDAETALNSPTATLLKLMGPNRDLEAMKLARLVTIHGPLAIENLPHLRMKALLTADRSEVEAIRILSQVVRRYKDHDDGKKPLSIGVFGPPGAGKSFAVKQLADEFLGKKGAWLEFNLSQFPSSEELNGAFHQIRDLVLQGKLPIAFFDEFDSQKYKWLQYLLAPMQDGKFQEGEVTHTIGKCIFIFAGGTSWTYETFGPPEPTCAEIDAVETNRPFDEFRLAKGPDFKSRLDAFLDVVGPNRRPKLSSSNSVENCFVVSGRSMVEDEADYWYPIRRALLIRSELKLQPDSELKIDEGLLHALLTVSRYRNGSRSLSKVVGTLSQALGSRLQPSHLPPYAQLNMHCDAEEFHRLCDIQAVSPTQPMLLPQSAVDKIAPAIHEAYRDLGKKSGWMKPKGDDDVDLQTFSQKPKNKVKAASNFAAAERIPGVLGTINLAIAEGTSTEEEDIRIRQTLEYHLELLANAEHLGWMKWYLKRGWTYHPKRDDEAQHHNCLKPFTELSEADRTKDREQVRRYPEFLKAAGLKIVEK